MIVGFRFSIDGKTCTKKELLALGYTNAELNEVENKARFGHYVKGLCLQFFSGGWHSVDVIVDVNDRFVYLKRLRDLHNESVKPTRILKKKVVEEGYTMQACGEYPTEYTKYVGKIIEL